MQTGFDQLLENLLQLEDSPDWEVMVDSFITQTYDLSTEHSETASPHSHQLEVKSTMKDAVGIFIKKYMKKLRELKGIIDYQNDNITKLKSELNYVRDENEQLNEVSLTLISEIKKLKKYISESDIFVSILRGEIAKQKHQNKMLVNALKQLYEGNEDLATKILKDAFFESPDKTNNPPAQVLTSPESNHSRRHMSLIDDSLLSGINTDLKLRASFSTMRRKPQEITSLQGLGSPDNRRHFATEEVYSPERGTSIIVNEYEEYAQDFEFENALKENKEIEGEEKNNEDSKVLYSFEDMINEASEKNGSVVLGRLSNFVSKSPSEMRSPVRIASPTRVVPRIKNLLTLNQVIDERLCHEDIDFTVSEPFSASMIGKRNIEEIKFTVEKLGRVSKWLIPEKSGKLSMMKSSK